MEYKDAVGVDLKVGDHVTYCTVSSSGIQLGKVLELTTMRQGTYTYDSKGNGKRGYKNIPALKIQGARRSGWAVDSKWEKMKPSLLTHFENVLVLNGSLIATITLM